jgi:hypothetical protein
MAHVRNLVLLLGITACGGSEANPAAPSNSKIVGTAGLPGSGGSDMQGSGGDADTSGSGGTAGSSAGSSAGKPGGAGGSSAGRGAAGKPGRGGAGAGGGGASAGSGGSTIMGTGAGTAGPGEDADVSPECSKTGSPDDPPRELPQGVWTNITPDNVGIPSSGDNNVFTQGIAVDTKDPNTVYVTVSGFSTANWGAIPVPLCKTTNRGASWTKVGHFDQPIDIHVDPDDSKHLYLGSGVRGSSIGFWVSEDGGDTWRMPSGFDAVAKEINDWDVYHVEVDPSDFKHVLLSFHWYWHSGEDFGFGALNSGVLESTDGGESWTVHDPNARWAQAGGYAVLMLYNPDLGVGNSKTWLWGTQGAGFFRTEDGGKSWDKVADMSMPHGGTGIFYGPDKTLYVGGAEGILRSTNNGKSFETVSGLPSGGYFSIIGHADELYSAPANATTSFITSTDGQNWAPLSQQTFTDGPFDMALDSKNGILYASMWHAGVWALKL